MKGLAGLCIFIFPFAGYLKKLADFHFIISRIFVVDLLSNEKPDERQIMTYVSCYYHAFQGAMQVGCLPPPPKKTQFYSSVPHVFEIT